MPRATETHAQWLRRQSEWHRDHNTGQVGYVDYPVEVLRMLSALERIIEIEIGTKVSRIAQAALDGAGKGDE